MSGFFPSSLFSPTSAATWYNEPSLGNPATLAIIVADGGGEELPADIAGTFTLMLDGQVVISARQLFFGAFGPGQGEPYGRFLQGTISGTELAVAGWYQWEATITSISEDYTATLNGDFSL